MTAEPSLFNQPRKGTSGDDGLDYSSVPSGIAEGSKRKAFARIATDGTASNQRAKLSLLYYRVWKEGIRLAGEKIRALTDFEAAHITGMRESSVRGRRNALMGDGTCDAYEDEPVVQEAGTRKSLIKESSQEITTFSWKPDLFEDQRIGELLREEGVPDAVAEYEGGPAYMQLSPSQRAAIEAAASKAGSEVADALAEAFRTSTTEILSDY